MSRSVEVREELVTFPTYLPAAPDKNPMFLEKRVYQGSNGKVYPLPFTDRISETKTDRQWKALWIENEFLRVMVLPEIGGRIHIAQDKTNGYDFFYRQNVIKPALVGLAGPWISGGVEFNWPQHHRPATFLPMDFHCEDHADGSKTIWLSDHDPMARMKGMHGICLHPDKAYLELKVRAYNRTSFSESFLWWSNVGTRAHEGYQSFFPPDVFYVADHAKRATSDYPLAQKFYYGVNYGERGRKGIPKDEVPTNFVPQHCPQPAALAKTLPQYAPNDLSWYANIPTPCSYMCMGSKEDFVGGYDHFAQAGMVHVANHHIAPGKKQWTWGNHEFGYAWDRNLTDSDGPYMEIMAGVYTDNQPDFSFLQPGETRVWSQFWYPIQKIGTAQHANVDAAVHFETDPQKMRIGVSVSSDFPGARISLEHKKARLQWNADLKPGEPFLVECKASTKKWPQFGVTLRVVSSAGKEIIAYTPKPRVKAAVPPPATEPLPPEEMASADELFVTGLHLSQYRHATRCPTGYWREALRRDPLDSRCNNGMGLWHLRRGELVEAETYFRKAIQRLTSRNPNPYDGEAYYNLGLCLRYSLDAKRPTEVATLFEDSYAAFYKATWNHAWQSAAYKALAEMDCRRGHWAIALDHLDRSLRGNGDSLHARNLKAIVLRKLGRGDEANLIIGETLALDPLDWWARHLAGERVSCDFQTQLDIAHDFARAGFYGEAIDLLSQATCEERDLPDQNLGATPLIFYTLGWLHEKTGNAKLARECYRQAEQKSPDYCFPSRLEEIAVLEAAMQANPRGARAPFYLGNLLYDRRRHADAIKLWERSARLDGSYSVVWRNLGIGYFNIQKDSSKARTAYEKAFRANPRDARLLYERDQLWKRLGEWPDKRLRELQRFPELVRQRDDLCIELCALYNQTGRHVDALQLISSRKFQPWEGGEGQALGQHVRTQLALGREALAHHDLPCARNHFEKALQSPENLGEAKHLLANQSDIHFWLGVVCAELGDKAAAKKHWKAAATFRGDFQQMSIRQVSEMTFFSALALGQLGQKAQKRKLLGEALAYGKLLEKSKATMDYFATSLPSMLLFDDDIQFRQKTTALFLQAQARLGLGQKAVAQKLLAAVLKRDPNHAPAADLSNSVEIHLEPRI